MTTQKQYEHETDAKNFRNIIADLRRRDFTVKQIEIDKVNYYILFDHVNFKSLDEQFEALVHENKVNDVYFKLLESDSALKIAESELDMHYRIDSL